MTNSEFHANYREQKQIFIDEENKIIPQKSNRINSREKKQLYIIIYDDRIYIYIYYTPFSWTLNKKKQDDEKTELMR